MSLFTDEDDVGMFGLPEAEERAPTPPADGAASESEEEFDDDPAEGEAGQRQDAPDPSKLTWLMIIITYYFFFLH